MKERKVNRNPNRSLEVQAYNGQDIPNHIDPDPTAGAIGLAETANERLLRASVNRLGPATGRYNCHGLVFASRRTNIPPSSLPDSVDINDLLEADEFERVNPPPQVGDIIIYRSQRGAVDHSGIVSRIEPVGQQPTVFVWSMWGGLGEFEHKEDLSPYTDCTREYWRLKR